VVGKSLGGLSCTIGSTQPTFCHCEALLTREVTQRKNLCSHVFCYRAFLERDNYVCSPSFDFLVGSSLKWGVRDWGRGRATGVSNESKYCLQIWGPRSESLHLSHVRAEFPWPWVRVLGVSGGQCLPSVYHVLVLRGVYLGSGRVWYKPEGCAWQRKSQVPLLLLITCR
jgi:hypothetical protein